MVLNLTRALTAFGKNVQSNTVLLYFPASTCRITPSRSRKRAGMSIAPVPHPAGWGGGLLADQPQDPAKDGADAGVYGQDGIGQAKDETQPKQNQKGGDQIATHGILLLIKKQIQITSCPTRRPIIPPQTAASILLILPTIARSNGRRYARYPPDP